jgi:hypothetical protein
MEFDNVPKVMFSIVKKQPNSFLGSQKDSEKFYNVLMAEIKVK